MSIKPFWKVRKPDQRQKPFKNPLTVAGYVVDQWRKAAYISGTVAIFSMAGVGVAWGYALYKERMPTPIVTPMLNEHGRLVTLYTTNVDTALDDRIVAGVLRLVIDDLRTLSTEPDALSRLSQVEAFFIDDASTHLSRFLKTVDFGKPLLTKGFKRQVGLDINVARVPNTPDVYQAHWRERLASPMGTGEWVNKNAAFQVSRQTDIPSELAGLNPWGVFVKDFSSDTLD
jgi:type IV secretory pathway TrbF-like protein